MTTITTNISSTNIVAKEELPATIESLEDLYRLQRITTAMCQEYEQRRVDVGASGPPTTKTVQGYLRDFKRLEERAACNGVGIWTEAAKTESINTWKVRRAAILFCFHGFVRRAKKVIDSGATPDQRAQAIQKLLKVATTWQEIPDGLALEKVTPSKSKKQALRGLPTDWELQISRRMATSGCKYRLVFLAVALTGMRPDEMASGIEVKLTQASEAPQIMIKIRGSKVRGNAGQPWRVLEIDVIKSAIAREFYNVWTSANQPTRVQLPPTEPSKKHPEGRPEGSKTSFSRAIAYHASKIWASKIDNTGHAVTGYSLRHAVADDLRAGGCTVQGIAEALGHCTTVSQGKYGWGKGGRRGARALTKTHAARGVAETRTSTEKLDRLPKKPRNMSKARRKLRP
jgi:integrase